MIRADAFWRNLKCALVALFAAAQMFPAGVVFAQDGGDGLQLVICTPNGVQTISWEEATGEPSPLPEPRPDHDEQPCHASVTGACSAAGLRPAAAFMPDVILMSPARVIDAKPSGFIRPYKARPPLPSRAPPAA